MTQKKVIYLTKNELNDITKAILEKYKDTPFKDNKALPNYTNQAMNRDIKELCKLAGTRTGRRTFIVNALSLGIPPNVVMNGLFRLWLKRFMKKACPLVFLNSFYRTIEFGNRWLLN